MLMAMGGYGDMGMMGGSTAGTGLIDSLKTKLSFLPEWAAILVIAVLVMQQRCEPGNSVLAGIPVFSGEANLSEKALGI